MVQINSLNTIVRFVTADYKVASSEECHVVIDATTRKAVAVIDGHGTMHLEKAGVFRWFKERRHVLVVNTSQARREAEGVVSKIYLRDFARQWTLGLQVKYLASCKRGNEAKVAQALCAGPSPEEALNQFISGCIQDYAGPAPGQLIEKFYERRADIEAYLAARTLDEIGLNFQALVTLESEQDALQTIRLAPICFSVRVNDYHEEQPMKLEAEIGIYEPARIYAIVHHAEWFRKTNSTLKEPAKLEDQIKFETRKFFATSVSLHRFLAELQSTRLRMDLIEHLNLTLRQFGREVASLSLAYKGAMDQPVKPFFETKEDVEVDNLQEYNEKVLIKSSVQMILKDYALNRISGPQSLESWLTENLSEVVNQVLFGKHYLDLLIRFDPLKNEIKEKLSTRAENIGYSIKQLITVPNLPPYDWLEKIPLEIKGWFETATPKFSVNLGIYGNARIRRLQDIETYLNRSQSVPELMRQTITTEVTKLLHTIDPERFYMRFTYPDSKKNEQHSVEELLTQQIKDSLKAEFKADVTHLTLKMLDTDITRIWTDLERAEGGLEIKLPSLSDIEGVTYLARVRVDAIHSERWDRFRTTRPNITKVCQSLALHISARLGSFAYIDLAYTNRETQQQIEQMIEDLAKTFAVEEFGLVIRVNSIHRVATAIETSEKERINAILQAIKELEKQRLGEITKRGPAAAIQAIDDKINQLRAELPDTVKATINKYKREESIELAGPTRLPNHQITRSIGAGNGNSHESHEGSQSETAKGNG